MTKNTDTGMMMPSERLRTFINWPFTEGCACLPEKMSEAGFYCCGGENEPDLVRCYFCRKELDGWEPDDDPWKEHASHAKGRCAFINLGKKSEELTVKDMYDLDRAKLAIVVGKMVEKRTEEFRKSAEVGRKELEKLL